MQFICHSHYVTTVTPEKIEYDRICEFQKNISKRWIIAFKKEHIPPTFR